MYDRKLVHHIFSQIIEALEKIERRFKPVSVNCFPEP